MYMKTLMYALAVTVLVSCESSFSDSYRLSLPVVPASWAAVLGDPAWRIEWINADGERERIDCNSGSAPVITVMQEWITPVIAYPYWPGRNLVPDTMKPAGALFPFDMADEQLVLTWEAGIDAVLYYEMVRHVGEETTGGAFSRLPFYFNWPGFRDLLQSGNIKEAVQADPWQADWNTLAARFIQSGFDRRAIVQQVQQEIDVPVPAGTWVGTSPFAPAIEHTGGDLILAIASTGVATFVSSAGILRCTPDAWILIPFP
jgi:hypothetical protein